MLSKDQSAGEEMMLGVRPVPEPIGIGQDCVADHREYYARGVVTIGRCVRVELPIFPHRGINRGLLTFWR
jgi:hypothetical protein